MVVCHPYASSNLVVFASIWVSFSDRTESSNLSYRRLIRRAHARSHATASAGEGELEPIVACSSQASGTERSQGTQVDTYFGVSFNGRTLAFDTNDGGSNPSAPTQCVACHSPMV